MLNNKDKNNNNNKKKKHVTQAQTAIQIQPSSICPQANQNRATQQLRQVGDHVQNNFIYIYIQLYLCKAYF